ncbi:MAG TPA: DinB family protein [Vicinamibacterales bacterium]|nr:DinB family protein [Vicinamibacterales bacterium]
MSDVTRLLRALDQGYHRPSWHGTNLRGSIRGLRPAAAARRPGRGRHNIQEIVVHCAYWKYAVWRLLTGAKRGAFAHNGSNWFPRSGADAAAWRADVALLDDMHRRLRAAVASLTPRQLSAHGKGRFTKADLVAGVTAHDLYHAGQIQLIKRFL